MNDDILNRFIEKLVTQNIDEDIFRENINVFSRFLGYSNSDYKYNATYLSQYIDDFLKMSHMLKRKDEIYNKIFDSLMALGYRFEILIDQVYWGSYLDKTEKGYLGMDQERILDHKIELKMIFVSSGKEYIFRKKYDKFDDEKLIIDVKKDVKAYIRLKRIRSFLYTLRDKVITMDELEGFSADLIDAVKLILSR